MKQFLYRLLFTRNDELDLAYVMLLGYQVFFIVWVSLVSLNIWTLHEPLIDAFLVVYGTTVLLGAPVWIAKELIQHWGTMFRRNANVPTVEVNKEEPTI